jgi:hypothetical protein
MTFYTDFPSCSGDVPNLTPDDFEKHMTETLEEVRKHIPKVFVNLVLLGNISEVRSNLEMC